MPEVYHVYQQYVNYFWHLLQDQRMATPAPPGPWASKGCQVQRVNRAQKEIKGHRDPKDNRAPRDEKAMMVPRKHRAIMHRKVKQKNCDNIRELVDRMATGNEPSLLTILLCYVIRLRHRRRGGLPGAQRCEHLLSGGHGDLLLQEAPRIASRCVTHLLCAPDINRTYECMSV